MGTKHPITEKILEDTKGESDFKILLTLAAHAAKMEEQRDELLALVKRYRKNDEAQGVKDDDQLYKDATNAIAKAGA